jgi:pimeloyl-ACP methyl ester carboxylesterase
MTQLKLPTTSLEYIDSGSGHPVVLVHGSASDHRTWDQQQLAFAHEFRVVNYSRRYHWPNTPVADGAEYSMSEQVDDLEQLIQALDIAGAHIIGHSYGAYLALMVAIRNPALVGSLVLAEPPVIPLFTSFPPKPHEILMLLVTRPRTALPIIKFAATGLGPAAAAARKNDMETAVAHFGKAVLGSRAFDSLTQTRREQVRINSSKAELLSDSFMTPLNAQDVRRIETRTLLITGENSPVIFHRLTDRLEELIPHAGRIDIPNASHIMHEDNAAAYDHAVLSFLKDA